MHRIDGPTAAPGGLWTEGDPVGGVPATIVSDDWMNDTQENLIGVLTAAGIAPVKNNYTQLLAAIRQVSSISTPGGSENLRCSIPTASTVATFTDAFVTVLDPATGKSFRRPAFNKTADISGTGVGKLDTGTAPANGFVATYAIYNETTNTDATLSQNATAAVAPETYTGAFMPAGYTASALISVLPTNGSSQFKPSVTLGRKVWPDLAQVLSTTTPQGTLTSLSIAGGVPRNAKTFDANLTVSCAVAGVRIECSLSGSPSPSPVGFTIDSRTNVSAGLAERFSMKSIPVITSQTTYYIVAPSSGALGGFNIDISGYTF